MNHLGQMLARAQQARTGIDGKSVFGDVWVYAGWHHKPDEPHPLMVEMLKLVPWWGRKHVESVRFRPDPDPADGSNPYLNGTATVFYKLPGQYLGPYLSRSRRMVDGEYFRLTERAVYTKEGEQ